MSSIAHAARLAAAARPSWQANLSLETAWLALLAELKGAPGPPGPPGPKGDPGPPGPASSPLPVYASQTDRLPRAKPALPVLGPAGTTLLDPTWGTPIQRLTDDKTASCHMASAAHIAAWSADSQAFYYLGPDGPLVCHWDGHKIVSTKAVHSQAEPTFSRTDPDTLYVVAGASTRTIQAYSLSKDTYSDVLDLDTLGLSLVAPRTYVGGVFSAAGTLVTFFGGESQDAHFYVLAGPKLLNTQTGTLNGKPTSLPAFFLHSASIDFSGRFVILYATSADISKGIAPKIVWDLQTDTFTPLPEVSARSGGHDSLGFGVMVNMEGTSPTQAWDAAQWAVRQLASPLVVKDLINPVLTPKSVTLDDHTSWNNANPDGSQPVYSATFHSGWSNVEAPRAWDDEIIAISLNGAVKRFCHHRSQVDPANFWTQPLLHVSPNGAWALFGSNWESARQDVFLATLS